MIRRHPVVLTLLAAAVLPALAVSVVTQGRGQQPTRDAPAQRAQEPVAASAGRISGRVLAADNARPMKGARVFVNAAELPGGRGVQTDENGLFDFSDLPAGRYTLSVSKAGFISLSYGQRRPLQAGTPLQLDEREQLTGIEFRLPRGSVIAGHVFDGTGEPMPGTVVQVMRYQYAQGTRQLVPAGGGQSDDRGAYRVWGLNPGDYYITAVARPFEIGGRGVPGGPGGGRGALFFGAGNAGTQIFAARGGPPGMPGDGDPVGYAPTYYPGVASVDEARPVTVGLGAETLDIDFSILKVRTSRISGRIVTPTGAAPSGGTLVMTAEGESARRGGLGRTFGARVAGDGEFSIAGVPPGRYVLRARAENAASESLFAELPLAVTEGDLGDLAVVLAPGGRISGTVTFQATQSATLPDIGQVRITAPAIDFVNVGPNAVARVDRDGRFTIEGVSAGSHWIRAQGAPRGWALRSVVVAGRDVIDTPLELRAGQQLSDVNLTFSDKLSEVNGTITDDHGTPLTEFTVLAFPTDATLWRAQARQIMTTRPDQNGKYQLRGLPVGEYFLTTVDPGEQGEWFEPAYLDQHRVGARRLSLGDGDIRTQDFKLTTR